MIILISEIVDDLAMILQSHGAWNRKQWFGLPIEIRTGIYKKIEIALGERLQSYHEAMIEYHLWIRRLVHERYHDPSVSVSACLDPVCDSLKGTIQELQSYGKEREEKKEQCQGSVPDLRMRQQEIV